MDALKKVFLFIDVTFTAGSSNIPNAGRDSPMAAMAARAIGNREIFFLKQSFPVNARSISFENICRKTVTCHELLIPMTLVTSFRNV